MSGDDFEKNVKRYYEEKTLSPAVLARLSAMAEAQQPAASFWPSRQRLFLVASLAVFIVIAAQFSFIFKASDSDLVLRVAQEVAMNHNKYLASEFISDSYVQLAARMDKLDFRLNPPQQLVAAGYQLLGARYCSIQGQIAGQFKLLSAQGETVTLYVTRLNETLATLNNRHQLRGDLLIQNWSEGELFFSLARQQ